MLPFSDERIYEYMEEQGYNLKQLEQKLLQTAKGGQLEPLVMEKNAEIEIGDYTFTVDNINTSHLRIVKCNGEGTSLPPELLDKIFDENL